MKYMTLKILCYQSKEEKTMVNKRFWLGILVMVLVFGLSLIGCEEKEKGKNCPKDGKCVAKYDAGAGAFVEDGCGCLEGQSTSNARCNCD
jgi:hypothetical protein